MFTKYAVVVEHFTKRHFIKNFKKKYKTTWEITWRAVIEEFKRMDALLNTSIAKTIVDVDGVRVVKTEFRIAGTKKSRKSSGNRCIVAVHQNTGTIYILLVYHKNDLGGSNETARWKQIIKKNYDQYKDLF